MEIFYFGSLDISIYTFFINVDMLFMSLYTS